MASDDYSFTRLNITERDQNPAVQLKRSLLSQCLLTVPRNLDLYPHRGNLQSHDSKYRSPWEKIKADADCLHEETLKGGCHTEALTTENINVFYPEPFESAKTLNDSVTECINFDLDSDVIPSSNPDSPDLFLQDDLISDGPNIFCETFRKENQFVLSTNNENLKLEAFLSTEDEEKLPNRVPELSKLIGKLNPMVVSDPLLDQSGQPPCEDNIFRSQTWVKLDEIQTCVEPTDLDIIQDKFNKQQILSVTRQNLELEDVVTEDIELTKKEDVYHALNTTLNTDLELLLPLDIDEDLLLTEEVTKRLIKNIKDVSLEIISYSTTCTDDERITFLDINEPENKNDAFYKDEDFTDLDDICEEAYLDTPVHSSPVLHSELEFPDCSSIEHDLSAPELIRQKEKEHIERVCFSSELYCGEIYAYRLSVPYSFDVETDPTIEVKYIQQVTQLVKLDQLSTAPTDLQLGWDIAEISDIGKDPSRMFDKLKGEISGIPVCDPVETFERALPEEFNELKEDGVNEDYELESLDSQPESRSPSPIDTEKQINDLENHIPDKSNEGASDKSAKVPSLCVPVRQKFDPLENFLALRCKTNEVAERNNQEITSTIDARIISESPETIQELPPRKVQTDDKSKPCLRQMANKGKKTKHHIVQVHLSDAYRSLLSNLEREASKYLSILKTDNEVSRSCAFQTLTPDVTRFLVKQREKYHTDNNIEVMFPSWRPYNGFLVFLTPTIEDDTYRDILCVHGLVGTAEILVMCCLESALGFLNAFQERYHHVVKNSLDTIHHSLLQSREKLLQQQIYHPKMTAMCKEIEIWLRKKRAKSGDNEQKILIIIKKDMPSLKNCLKKVLNLSKLLHPQVLETEDANSLIESLDNHNCLIVHTNQIAETFPWAQFSLVVEYEYQENFEWKDHCERQNISLDNHNCLIVHTNQIAETFPWAQFSLVVEYEYQENFEWKDHCERQNIRHMSLVLEQEQSDCEVGVSNMDQCKEQISLIASQHVTSNHALLQLLESRYNIQLYERDYSLLKFNKNVAFSDLDIDENTAFIIEDIRRLQEDKTLHCVVMRIVLLSLKYTVCYCLFYKDKTLSSGYPYPSHVIGYLSKLQAAVVNFERRSKSNYSTKILLCPDMNEMTMTIRRICEERLLLSSNTPIEQALDRSWLSTDITQEEKILLQNPCISSFNAQVLLKALGLKDIMTASVDQLTKAVPSIARTTLLALCEGIQKHPPLPVDKPTQQATKTLESDVIGLDSSQSHTEEEKDHNKSFPAKLTDIIMDKSDEKLDFHREETHIGDTFHGPYRRPSTANESREMISSTQKYEKYLINEKDTPVSCSQGQHKQNSSRGLDIFEQTLSEKPSRQQGIMPSNQHSRTMTASKKARRHLEFEHIGLTEVEKSFRQKFGSGRTPLKSDTRQQSHLCCRTSHRSDTRLLNGSGRTPQKSDTRQWKNDIDIPTLNHSFGENVNFPLNQKVNLPNFDPRTQEHQQEMEFNIDPHPCSCQAFLITNDDDKENNGINTRRQLSKPAVTQTKSLYQNVVGQPIQTFDYNHGIPKQEDTNLHQRNIHHYLPENDRSSEQLTRPGRVIDSMTAFDKEYPPSVEIDRLVSLVNTESNRGLDDLQGNSASSEYPQGYLDSVFSFNRKQSLTYPEFDQHNNPYSCSFLRSEARQQPSYPNLSTINGLNDQKFTEQQYLPSKDETKEISRYNYEPDHSSSIYNLPLNQQRPMPQDSGLFLKQFSASTLDRNKEIQSDSFNIQQNLDSLHFLNQTNMPLTAPTHTVMERKNMTEKKTFFNPCMERLSLRPSYTAPVETETNSEGLYPYSHEDKSQEAFWKLLQTKFGSSASRYPIQKRSIGLAQPVQRSKVDANQAVQDNNQSMVQGNQTIQEQSRQNRNQTIQPTIQERQDNGNTRLDDQQKNRTRAVDQTRSIMNSTRKAVPLWSSEEKRRMLQSPWATEDSPPMDLDYEDSHINRILHPDQGLQELTNRSVFTGATPDKKRRLSYERVPGRKGQTKLTFN